MLLSLHLLATTAHDASGLAWGEAPSVPLCRGGARGAVVSTPDFVLPNGGSLKEGLCSAGQHNLRGAANVFELQIIVLQLAAGCFCSLIHAVAVELLRANLGVTLSTFGVSICCP